MKNTILIIILTILAIISLASCGHNLGMVGIGTGFRVGGGEYGACYGDGLFTTFVTKDGIHFRAELDSTAGFSYDPQTNTYKGIKSVEYSLPPQVTGYAVDFARNNPEVAKAYYKALSKYYESRKKATSNKAPLVSDEKSKDASSKVTDVLKKALDKAKSLASSSSDEPFICSGDCELTGLADNNTIAYQSAVATKLLTYADDTTKFEGEPTTLKHSLEAFLTRMEQLTAKGKMTTKMRIKYAKVEGGKLTAINYVMIEDDGNTFETHCPECVLLEE